MEPISYRYCHFPPAIVQHSVWLYASFPLSSRDVEDLLAERGIVVSCETIRRWVAKFGPRIAHRLRQQRCPAHPLWHLDEIFASIGGKRMYLWRAIDQNDEILDLLVQSKRNKRAALRLMRKLLKKTGRSLLAVHDATYNTFNTRRHLCHAPEHLDRRQKACGLWNEAACAAT